MFALRTAWVVAVILAGMFGAGSHSLESRLRAAYFSGGAAGVMHRIHPDLVRANIDGTGAVAVGDAVGWVRDLSPHGLHATQVTATARPTLALDALGYYLDFDAVDDSMKIGPVATSAGGARTLGFAGDYIGAGTQIILGRDSGNGEYIGRVSSNHIWASNVSTTIAAGAAVAHSVIGYTQAGTPHLMVDGVDTAGTGTAAAVNYSQIAANGLSVPRYRVAWRGGLFAVKEPSAGDLALLNEWLDTLRGA